MSTSITPQGPSALIPVDAAAAILGVGVKRFKNAVDAKQMGRMWLMQIGNTTYVHRHHLDAFVAGKSDLEQLNN
ncbi:hypothetical protein [Variovorax sp. LG9.2]|uniref:hypothetical protein n=1 Tax=Variovorax sp. LG9.2 TaxID=3048626 RepID=UPI002B22A84D|nr:hypothetical protein [Variovorax sp. LG9.2]MEB0056491.1 hypothetical protein [Variovorax sp. LG9.2]